MTTPVSVYQFHPSLVDDCSFVRSFVCRHCHHHYHNRRPPSYPRNLFAPFAWAAAAAAAATRPPRSSLPPASQRSRSTPMLCTRNRIEQWRAFWENKRILNRRKRRGTNSLRLSTPASQPASQPGSEPTTDRRTDRTNECVRVPVVSPRLVSSVYRLNY